jgi:Flp pilus assembly protein TadG
MKHVVRTSIMSSLTRLNALGPRLKAPADFCADERGTFAIVLALMLVPVIATFGLAANYSAANGRRTDFQTIADAAALAGATAAATDGDEARKARAQKWFDTQAALLKMPPAKVTVSVKNGTVTVDATATVAPMINMSHLGAVDVKVSSTAQIAQATIRRVLDVAFCIDATGSMQNTIDSVKARANSFSDDLNSALTARGLEKFDYTRIRAVFYRDFSVDDGKKHGSGWRSYIAPLPMSKSEFFEMPGKKGDLTLYLGTENAGGGGDLPESGYECIHEGMTSKWWKKDDKIPHTDIKADAIYPVIVLWSDADAKPIGDKDSLDAELYPKDMPTTDIAFVSKWNTPSVIDQENRMLVQFGLCTRNSWATARALIGYMCGGTLNEGNTNMVNKIADAMMYRYKNLTTRLTK